MELASNLVWACLAVAILAMTYGGVRHGRIKRSMASSMTLAVLICFLLLPVISVSDDLLEARQAALPLAGQAWRIASEDSSNGLAGLPSLGVLILLLMSFALEPQLRRVDQWSVRALAGRLARSQRLRPPPSFSDISVPL